MARVNNQTNDGFRSLASALDSEIARIQDRIQSERPAIMLDLPALVERYPNLLRVLTALADGLEVAAP
jgi:hypothetical protein